MWYTLARPKVLGVRCGAGAVQKPGQTTIGSAPHTKGSGGMKQKIVFKIKKKVPFGHELTVVGNRKEVGGWLVSQGAKMNWEEGTKEKMRKDRRSKYVFVGDLWTSCVELPVDVDEIQYKYAVTCQEDVEWCPGSNYTVSVGNTQEIEIVDEWANPELSRRIVKDWNKMTVRELKDCLRDRGLPVSGNKSVLLARLNSSSLM